MTIRPTNQIIFDPEIMTLALAGYALLFSVLMIDSFVHRSSPYFFWTLFCSIEFALLWIVASLKNQIDKFEDIHQVLERLRERFISRYSKTYYPNFSKWDWFFFLTSTVLIIICLSEFYILLNVNIQAFSNLASGKLPESEEKIWELLKSEALPLMGMYLTLSILGLTFLRDTLNDVKKRVEEKKITERYNFILRQLDEIQEWQKRK